ncbi:hypothetical protein, partial [Mediterraneibacter faecis]|uniref:hypothetical protein n=1 Tax=Mediterraneibacter faecis TaxID=592978 RepID=UPI001EDE97FF
QTWNMGQGMVIATPTPEEVMRVSAEYGINSKVIGEISSRPGIRIMSRGINSDKEKELYF